MLSRIARDHGVVAAAFVLAGVLSLAALGSMNQRFAQRQVQLQSTELLQGFATSLAHAKQELQAIQAAPPTDCVAGLSPALASRTYSDGAVRWLAMARHGQLLCRSHVVGIPWQSPHRLHQIDAAWSLMVLEDKRQGYGLFLKLDQAGQQYLAALEPPRLDYIEGAGCNGCRRLVLSVPGNPTLQITDGVLQGPVDLSRSAQQTWSGLNLSLSLQADQRFSDHYRLQGWLASAGIAALVALLAAALLHRVLKTRASLDYLLKEGLRRQAFVPFYQPIVDSRSGQVMGAEALVRWRRPDGSMVPPGQFIPYAEESGLILPITDQLTHQVVRDIARFGWAGSEHFVSINLVPEQLHTPAYGQQLAQLISQQGLQGRNVSVEITERRQFHDLVQGRQVLSLLVQQGIEIKLDDAGTGFGGFSYVQELPIGTLKIDKMFVDTLRTDSDAKRPVLDAIVQFAQRSGLAMIAEGVETEDQVRKLADMGVHAIQGYVYGKPMSADDFMRWMATR